MSGYTQLIEEARVANDGSRPSFYAPWRGDLLERLADALESALKENAELLVAGAPQRRSNRKWKALERDRDYLTEQLSAAHAIIAKARDRVDFWDGRPDFEIAEDGLLELRNVLDQSPDDALEDHGRDLAAIAFAQARYGECVACGQPYERFDSPTGLFYSHFVHPVDEHDVVLRRELEWSER